MISDDEPIFRVNEYSNLPIWVQLRNRIEYLIHVGYFTEGTQLPSVRSLAADAQINYNTVARAYNDLELAGTIIMVRGRGMYVKKNCSIAINTDSADALLKECVEMYCALGMTLEETRKYIADAIQKQINILQEKESEAGGYRDGKITTDSLEEK